MLKQLASAVSNNKIVSVEISPSTLTFHSATKCWSFGQFGEDDTPGISSNCFDGVWDVEDISIEIYTNWLRVAHKCATKLYEAHLKTIKPS